LNKPDYRIIKIAKETGAVLVTQDINMRVIADAVDVESTHYAPNDVDVNQLYTGKTEFNITDEEAQDFACCDYLAQEGIDAGERSLTNNQFVSMVNSLGQTTEGIYKADGHIILPLKPEYKAWGITPKRDKYKQVVTEQKYLMHLLLDPEIQFVTALGPSGTGKTLLTMAAALEQTLNHGIYKKVTVMRPLIAVGNDIGFLPGDKLEKLEPWMASTFDALELLLEDYQEKDGDDDNWLGGSKEKVYNLIHTGRLELEAMAHIRGRSLPNQFLIIDDAQNLTQHEAASIITRAGDGTKVVFLGDLSEKQIDNHRLTPSSNGLAYVIDRFKGEDIVGHITLNTVVRSRLAQLGVEKL
jgi:PhoH-like ATPase